MCKSRRTQSGRRLDKESRNSRPEANVSTSMFDAISSRPRALRTDSSSSTTATRSDVDMGVSSTLDFWGRYWPLVQYGCFPVLAGLERLRGPAPPSKPVICEKTKHAALESRRNDYEEPPALQK